MTLEYTHSYIILNIDRKNINAVVLYKYLVSMVNFYSAVNTL